jgi:RNA polymerase sigma-70 factor (ECF subfamily)
MIGAGTMSGPRRRERVFDEAGAVQRAALDGFLRQVERRALRMAELATRNIDDALELVQEAMLVFVRNYAEKPPADWPPLFHRVLDSRLLDFHRRQQVRGRWSVLFGRRSDCDDPDETTDPLSQVADEATQQPLRLLEGSQAMADLQAALTRLPHRQRQAFLLRHWEGFDGVTTAAIMGCTEGSVKTHLSRALQALRQTLEEHR